MNIVGQRQEEGSSSGSGSSTGSENGDYYVNWYDEENGGGGSTSFAQENCDCHICPVCGGCLDQPIQLKSIPMPGEGETTVNCPMCSCSPEIFVDMEAYPCAANVYLSFAGFDNTISTLLMNTFGSSENFHVRFRPSSSLANNVDGLFTGSTDVTFENGVITGGTFYIDINTFVLNNSTKEYIGVTYAHEVIHALIQYYELNDPVKGKELFPIFYETPDLEDGEHLTMGRLYVDEMTDIIRKLNPSLPANDATCLAWGGLQNTRAYDMQRFQYDQINGSGAWDQLMSVVNTREKNSFSTANGTPCLN